MPATHSPSPVRRIFVEAFNQGDLAVVDQVLSPNHSSHNAFGGAPNGPEGLKWLIAMFRIAFPDLHCTVDDEIRAGDKIAAQWRMGGTHQGLFLGNQPTGKRVKMQGMIFARIANGLIAEYWLLIDQFGLLQQLGIIPH